MRCRRRSMGTASGAFQRQSETDSAPQRRPCVFGAMAMARSHLRFKCCTEAAVAGYHCWGDFKLLFPRTPCARHPKAALWKMVGVHRKHDFLSADMRQMVLQ